MIVRHGGKPRRALKVHTTASLSARQSRSSMMGQGSDGDESGHSDEDRGGYSDEGELELEAGCMGVRDPRELKRNKADRGGMLKTAAFVLLFFGIGASLPFLLWNQVDTAVPGKAALTGVGADAASSSTLAPVSIAAMPNASSAGAALVQPVQSVMAAAMKIPALFKAKPGVVAWGATSSKTKEALKALVAAGTVHLEPLWLQDELEGGGVVFASGDGSCADVCTAGGKEWMCTPEWFAFLNHCEVLRAAFPTATDCLVHLQGRDLPAFSANLGGQLTGSHVMINANPDKYQPGCKDVGDHTQRLCACRKRVETQEGADINKRVSKIVIRQLRELAGKIAKGDTGKQGVHGSINEFWAAHPPGGLIEDVKSGRNIFLEAPRGTNCFDACLSKELACQRHWFDVLNNCAALQAAFPEQKACSVDYYGRDLPAYRPEDSTVLVNKEPKTYAASCGGRHAKTRRLCGCGVRKGTAIKETKFHTVYNVEPTQYFEWQVRYMHFWFKQSV